MSECLAIIVNDAKRRKTREGREDIAPFVKAAAKECEALAHSQGRKQAEASPGESAASADYSKSRKVV